MKIELIYRSSREINRNDYVYNLFIIDETVPPIHHYIPFDAINNLRTAISVYLNSTSTYHVEEFVEVYYDKSRLLYHDTKLVFKSIEELEDYFAEELI